MKNTKYFITAFWFIICFSCSRTKTAVDDNTLNIVERFYDNVATIVHNPDSDESFLAKEECIEMCKISDLSWNFPNEFKWMGLFDREENNVSPISYVTLLRKFANRNKVEFTYYIENSYKYKEDAPDSLSFKYFIVSKNYKLDNFECSFKDTVLVSPDTLIIGIKNISGGHAFTPFELEKPVSDIMIK